MFYGCSSLKSVDLSKAKFNQAVNASYIFSGCTALESVKLPAGMKLSAAKCMFGGEWSSGPRCTSLTAVDLSNVDFSEAPDVSHMFSYCTALQSVKLPSGAKLGDASGMFSGCENLDSVDLSDADLSACTDLSSMFSGCELLNSVSFAGADLSNVTSTYGMFESCVALATVDFSSAKFKNITSASHMFCSCSHLKKLDLAGFTPTGDVDTSNMFYDCSSLTQIALPNSATISLSAMDSMFSGCERVKSLDVSSFDTSKVTSMSRVFSSCAALTALDLSSFDTSNVKTMASMLDGCSKLRSVKLSSFSTGRVQYMDKMFQTCSNLRSLDLSNFDTSHLLSTNWMFSGCSKLKSLDLSSFDTSNVDDMECMFQGTFPTTIKLGAKFLFEGSQDERQTDMPDNYSVWGYPYQFTGNYISSVNGKVYASDEVPSGVAATYTAQTVSGGSSAGVTARISGQTRYDTMSSLVSMGNWGTGGTVILASGQNFPDALAAASLAGDREAPILLTDPGSLSEATCQQLQQLYPSTVYIVGGTAAVSNAVKDQVKQAVSQDCKVRRLQGATRYDTGIAVAGALTGDSDTVVVATGEGYADALSISPYAYATGSPVLLASKGDGLSNDALALIKNGGYKKAVIVGGTAAVPAKVASQLASAGIATSDQTRLAGDTRYDTSQKIAKFELASSEDFDMDGVFLATGENFPDALAAGPVAGQNLAPLLLVDGGGDTAAGFLKSYKGKVSSATVVGGQNAVSDGAANKLASALGLAHS